MKLARNVSAGLASTLWSALLGLAVVPFYLKYLGIESYGLIGFFVTTQALFQILDMGVAPTVNREMARFSASGQLREMRNLLHTLSLIYWCMAALIGIGVAALASTIAGHWLNARSLPLDVVSRAMMLMGLVIACRWPIGLYQSALNGLQYIGVSSAITIVMSSLGAFGSVFVLAFVSRTVEAFFLWQATVGFLYALVLRGALWRAMAGMKEARLDFAALRPMWKFSVSMLALSVSGLIFSQLDKVILSKLLSLDAFGQYMLAGVVASALNVMITPFFNAIYPRFSAYIASGLLPQLFDLYRISARLLATLLFSVAMIVAVAGEDIIRLWTHDADLAHRVAPLAALIAIGTAVHGTMYIPYALQLAQGKTFIPLLINLIMLVIMVPVTVSLTFRYGALGGAIAWLILHLLHVALATFFMQKYVGHSTGVTWLVQEIGVPLLICGAIGIFARAALNLLSADAMGTLAFVFACALAAVLATFAASPQMRFGVLRVVRQEIGR